MPSDNTRFDHTRRRLLRSIGVLGGLGLTGCLGDEGDEPTDGTGDEDDEPTDGTDDEDDEPADGTDDEDDEPADGTDDEDDEPADGTDDEEEPAPAVFEITEIDPSEVQIEEGGTFDVAASITNAGETEGTQDVEVRIDGETVASESLTLAGGEDEQIGFEAVETEGFGEGEYTFGVYTEDSELTGTLTVNSATVESLVHHWPMNEGEGETVADVAGGADGTIQGVQWVEDDWVGGYALENDDRNSVVVSNLGEWGEDLNQDFAIGYTIEADFEHHADAVFSSRDDPHGINIWYNINLWSLSKSVALHLHDGSSGGAAITEENDLLEGGRHRVVVNKLTNDPENWEIYIDGEAVETRTEGGELVDIPPLPDEAKIFYDDFADSNYIEGILDNLKIWNEARDADEISQDFADQPWT